MKEEQGWFSEDFPCSKQMHVHNGILKSWFVEILAVNRNSWFSPAFNLEIYSYASDTSLGKGKFQY